MKTKITSAVVTLFLLSLPACDNMFIDPCLDCYQDKPNKGILSVSLTYSDGEAGIPVTLFLGPIEDSLMVLQDTVSDTHMDYWVNVGHRYTAVAEYHIGPKTIYAVDGDKVSVYLDTESCDVPCWKPNDGKANCRLN